LTHTVQVALVLLGVFPPRGVKHGRGGESKLLVYSSFMRQYLENGHKTVGDTYKVTINV